MAYTIKGKVYTDHALMDEIVYNCRLIAQGIILKNETEADKNETKQSLVDADDLRNVVEGNYIFKDFPFTTDDFVEAGYTSSEANYYIHHLNEVAEDRQERLLQIGKRNYLANYVEKNDYYRKLNGLAPYTSDSRIRINKAIRSYTYYSTTSEDRKVGHNRNTAVPKQIPLYSSNGYSWIYVSSLNPKLKKDSETTDLLPFDLPIHEWSKDQIKTIQYLGILDDIIDEYGTTKSFGYLKYITRDKIDYYRMRRAGKYDILFMPACKGLVKEEFSRLYELNRQDYIRKADQLALSYGSDYYEQMVMLLIICQTITDMIANVPEWYIRRDIFDLRSVQYFLESNDVAFYKEIPLKYQIRIVKNLNKLIRYKSTTTNIEDILNIFSLQGTKVYKYFLYKDFDKYVGTDDSGTSGDPSSGFDDNPFDDFDFGYITDDSVEGETKYTFDLGFDNWDEYETDPKKIKIYDFDNMSALEPLNIKNLEAIENYKEKNRTIVDENGNKYELKFSRCLIDGNYDNYIKNPLNQYDYDELTEEDKYWDGEDTHYYVKNQHLAMDTTVDGTKYMSLNYDVDTSKYLFQMEYFLGMIFNSRINDFITIPIPSIDSESSFKLTDIFILLHVLSYAYENKVAKIRIPENVRTDEKPSYSNYRLIDGGYPWSGKGNDKPYVPEPTDETIIDDFGFEDTDRFYFPSYLLQLYDYGYNNDIDGSAEVEVKEYGVFDRDDTTGNQTLVGSPSKEIQDFSKGITYFRNMSSIPETIKALNEEEDFGMESIDSEEESLKSKAPWVFHSLYDFFDEDPEFVADRSNAIGTDTDYNYGDEESDRYSTKGVLRNYDFNEETIGKYWDDYPSELYDDKIDGGEVVEDWSEINTYDYDYDFGFITDSTEESEEQYLFDCLFEDDSSYDPYAYDSRFNKVEIYDFNDPAGVPVMRITNKGVFDNDTRKWKWRRRVDGGDKKFSVFTHDNVYDWIRTNHPDLFVDPTSMIYGFNFSADLTDIKNHVDLKHSLYGFKDGIDAELNSDLNQITFPKLTDEDGNVATFVVPFNGRIDEYSELYSIYTTNTQCYNIITQKLSHPESRDAYVMYKYIFDSLFTTKFDFGLYLDKSGNPYTTYDQILKSRSFILYEYYQNLMSENDNEARIDNIRTVLNDIIDTLEYYIKGDNIEYIYSFAPIYSFNNLIRYMMLMINFFKSWKVRFLDPRISYTVQDGKDGMDGSGKLIRSDMLGEVKDNYQHQEISNIRDSINTIYKFDFKERRVVLKEVMESYYHYQGDVDTTFYFDGSTPDAKVTHMKVKDSMTFDKSLLDGGDPKQIGPKYKIDSGGILDGKDEYDIEGGTPYPQQYLITVDGGTPEDQANRYNKFPRIDGGGIAPRVSQTDSVWVETEKQTIHSSVKLDRKKSNAIIDTMDGLYLKDSYAEQNDYIQIKDDLDYLKKYYYHRMNYELEFILAISSEEKLNLLVLNTTEEILHNAISVVNQLDHNLDDTKREMQNRVDKPIFDFTQWFDEVCPFRWSYF